MTANLLVRRDAFTTIGGFDERFDNPSFREDTDIGWRLLDIGKVPFAGDVNVHHPAASRDSVRESAAERNRYFVKDPLLMVKHPDRYFSLVAIEGHHFHTPGFWWHFLEGAKPLRGSIDITAIRPHVSAGQWQLFRELWELGHEAAAVTHGDADPTDDIPPAHAALS